jgi:hypothetical protein
MPSQAIAEGAQAVRCRWGILTDVCRVSVDINRRRHGYGLHRRLPQQGGQECVETE